MQRHFVGLAVVLAAGVMAGAGAGPGEVQLAKAREYAQKAEALLLVAPTAWQTEYMSSYDSILESLANAKMEQRDYVGARAEIARMDDPLYQTSAYCSLAKALFRDGDASGANAALDLCLALKVDRYGRETVLMQVGRGRADLGDVKGLKEILAASADSATKAVLWTAIATVESRTGHKQEADSAFASALAAAAVEGPVFSFRPEIATAQWVCGEPDAARATMKLLPHESDQAYFWLRIGAGDGDDDVLAQVSPEQRKAALEEARKECQDLPADERARYVTIISGNLALLGDIEAAKKLWPVIEADIKQRAVPRSVIGDGESMNTGAAQQRTFIMGWVHLAGAQLAAGDEAAYAKSVATAWAAVEQLPEAARLRVYPSVAADLAEYGKFDDAVRAIHQVVSSPKVQPMDLSAVEPAEMTLICRFGVQADADWIEKFSSVEGKAEFYAEAAEGLARREPRPVVFFPR